MNDHRFLLAALLLLMTPGAFAGDSPADVVGRFYAWTLQPAPEKTDEGLAPVQQLLGQALFAALEAQRTYEEACARLVPEGVKPHMLDQSPFFLWPDGAQALLSTQTTVAGDTARVSARLAYDDLHWTDTVLLGHEDDRWVILDIQWQERSLTERLVGFASHRCEP